MSSFYEIELLWDWAHSLRLTWHFLIFPFQPSSADWGNWLDNWHGTLWQALHWHAELLTDKSLKSLPSLAGSVGGLSTDKSPKSKIFGRISWLRGRFMVPLVKRMSSPNLWGYWKCRNISATWGLWQKVMEDISQASRGAEAATTRLLFKF